MSMSYPKIGVSAVIWHEGKVLLAKRGQEPSRGLWSLPGGKLKFGETLEDGIRREVGEETGLKVQTVQWLTICEVIHPDDGFHYVVHVYETVATSNQALACDDVDEVVWVNPEALHLAPTTKDLKSVLQLAVARKSEGQSPHRRSQ